jgi:hypothetical protein
MSDTANTDADRDRVDRLYALLPAIYRERDAQRGYPLNALLRVIAEQVDVVEDDIAHLYENWFIETADDWVVPYIGALVGYRPAYEAGAPGDVARAAGRARNKILIPRRAVANTIRNRRRKGTLPLLELLAMDVAGWPARAVEFYRLLAWSQAINHQHLDRARTVDVRDGDALDGLDGPFDRLAHNVDVRRIAGESTPGRHNIPSVGVFVWRLRTYPVTKTPACCLEDVHPHCYTFSVLGQDTPLHARSVPESAPCQIATEENLSVPVRRRAFERRMGDFYGDGSSLAIWAPEWGGQSATRPIRQRAIIAADLSDWRYVPPRNHVAVDPVRGRIAFPPGQLPKRNVRVSYRYAFSADIGGGEYDRTVREPRTFSLYRVGEGQPFARIGDALGEWRKEKPPNAVIEVADSGVYVEQIAIALAADQSLQLRAANRTRPVIRLLDWHTDLPDSLTVFMGEDSRFSLDGLMVTGRSVHIAGQRPCEQGNERGALCAAEVTIRHCTLVPGWGLDNHCNPRRPVEPSLELYNVRARLSIEQSIVGSIQIQEDEVHSDPIPVHLTDSIVDATDDELEAIGAPGDDESVAHAVLTMRNCTVFGIVEAHAVDLAENCIFYDCVNVARRQVGCMRFCYVPPGCRTPRRYHCQPDLASADLTGDELRRELLRARPQFNSVRYGTPQYCQLADTCAEEIQRGADDESEMGAFHDLYQPQRAANLRVRLREHVPAGMETAIIFAS